MPLIATVRLQVTNLKICVCDLTVAYLPTRVIIIEEQRGGLPCSFPMFLLLNEVF